MITVHWTYFIEVICGCILWGWFGYQIGVNKYKEHYDWAMKYMEEMAKNLNKLWKENQELKEMKK